MSTLAISLVSTPDWVERLDRAVQAVTESARAARSAMIREKAVVKFFVHCRTLNGHIAELISSLDETTRELQSGTLEPAENPEHVDPAVLIAKMQFTYKIIHGLYVIASFAGLKSRKLTKGEVKKLGDSAEVLLDYIMWISDAVSREALEHAESTFADGLRELEAGETVAFV